MGKRKLAISCDLRFRKVNPLSIFCLKQIVSPIIEGARRLYLDESKIISDTSASLSPLQHSIAFHFVLSVGNLFKFHGDIALNTALCTEQARVEKFSSQASLNFKICSVVQFNYKKGVLFST